MSANNTVIQEKSAIDLLQEINSGLMDARLLDKPNRQLCVELLKAEGYTQPQISQVLKCSEKTVSRDLKDIRSRNELTPNVEFAKEFVGDVFKKAMNHHDFLVRLARAKDTPQTIKAMSELGAWRVLKEFIEKMQSLGYLPLMPQQVVGDIFHHSSLNGDAEALEKSKKMILEIESVAKETNTLTPDLDQDLQAMRGRIENAEIVTKVEEIKEKQKEASKKMEEDHAK